MQKVVRFHAGRLKAGKILFFLSALLMWLALILDTSILWQVIGFQMIWVFFSSIFSGFIVGSTEECDEISNPDIAMWLANFWITVLVSTVMLGLLSGIGVFISMMLLIALGGVPALLLGSRQSKTTNVDYPSGFGN